MKFIKIFSIALIMISVPVFASNLKEKIFKECIDYTDEQILEGSAPKCTKAIATYLQKFADDKIRIFDQGLYSFLSIALRAEMPQAYKVIEKEIYEGHMNDWIDKLEELNPDLYGKSLTKWARHVESEVRKIYKVEENKKEDYTVLQNDNQPLPELMSIWSPILMTHYLNFLSSPTHHIDSDDLSSINIIYAFSTASFRDVFGEQISKIILKSSDKWVKSLRKEQTWVLFRLFALIPNNADGNIKRELIWLEKYHQDFRIRAMASSTLTKIEK